MSAKIIIQLNQMFGYWKVIEPNVINPKTTSKIYQNKPAFSKCLCTNCNETVRYILNTELKKYSHKKCKKCSTRERVSKDWPKIGEQFGLLTVIGDAGIYGDTSKSRHYSLCQCKCGSVVEVQDNKLKTKNTQSCGKCISSKGEQKIIQLLKENNINFDHDKSFPPMVKDTGRYYRFDFIVYDNNNEIMCFIEFDGRQHFYEPDTNYWGRSVDTLETIQEKDKIKNEWCLKNNYKLIRIPFYALNNLSITELFNKEYEVI